MTEYQKYKEVQKSTKENQKYKGVQKNIKKIKEIIYVCASYQNSG